MPDSTSTAAQPRQGVAGNAAEEPWYRRLIEVGQQVFIVWVLVQLGTRFLASQFTPPRTESPQVVTEAHDSDAFKLPPIEALPAWQLGQTLSMHVRLSASPLDSVLSASQDTQQDDGLPRVVWDNIVFGDWSEMREVSWAVEIPESAKKNGSLWADVFLVKDGASPYPRDANFKPESVYHIRKLITPYLPKTKVRREKSLLGSSGEESVDEEQPDVIVPHWNGNLTLTLVSDAVPLPWAKLPPMVTDHIQLVPNTRDATGTRAVYMPIVFQNDFWHLRSQYNPVNETTSVLPLHITFHPISYFKFQMFASMTHGFNEAASKKGGASSAEIDEIKRMLVETNPWFLGLTATVSVLHVVFEMLAFKSDVSHWRNKKELVGVSIRTILTNVLVQSIILLYLIDNNTETSWMILFGSGVGILIEAWKITKAVDISIVQAPPGRIIPFELDIKDKHVLSEDEKKTQEYDKLAFRYVSYVAIPCLACYTIYSLLYETHRGWYSFVISTLTSFVYMFGFAQLIPQLIINYKLKSVAHMPMKAMIYKTLSTVIDDLFAFCIKMPFLHRLACFRDDVVFLVFLYQRWIYRIDPKRINEYGQVMVTDTVVDGDSETKKDR